MKKGWLFLLLGLTILSVGLIVGILIGRSMQHDPVILQLPPENTQIIQTTTDDTQPQRSYLININTASVDLLDSLPGIGPKLAQRIVDYRQEYGAFRDKEELTNVEGIGKEKLSAIYDLITVEDKYENSGS